MRRSPSTITDDPVWSVTQNSPRIGMAEVDREPRLSEYGAMLADKKWSIISIICFFMFIGIAYVLLATPIYRANLLIQVEDAGADTGRPENDTSRLLGSNAKTPATGEMQVIGSRLIVGAAVDELGLKVAARPKYLPVVGPFLARQSTGLSDPGFLGLSGYVMGKERIKVAQFEVPASFEDVDPFQVTALGNGRFTLRHEMLDKPIEGIVGQPQRLTTPEGNFKIQLSELEGKPGAAFTIAVASQLRATEQLQGRMQLTEQGKQSNVINVSLEDTDRARLAQTLNAIGRHYLAQNMERKSAEAEKTLAFLETQLPTFQRQVETSEDAYARYRKENGTVSYDDEAKVWLQRTSELQTALLSLQQQRRELDVNYTDQSPKVILIAKQTAAVQSELSSLNARISNMPTVQRDALRLERDVRVSTSLYQMMQNSALQMRLLKEGKLGNARLIDAAAVSKIPAKPQKLLILAFATVLGLLLGPAFAILRTRSMSGIRNPEEIESYTGLDVKAVVPQSPEQRMIDREGRPGLAPKLLADLYPQSHPVESIRGLRVALKGPMDRAENNRILITGPAQGIGKSFIAANFAVVLAQAGKRVLLINADLRKSSDPSKFFGLAQEKGLAELVAGNISITEAIHPRVRTNLDVLTSGAPTAFPSELLESQAFNLTMDTLSLRYDAIILDAAPVLIAADAIAIAALCGVVLLVARADVSERGELGECVRRLAQADVDIDGVLFNGMNFSRRYNGAQGYRFGVSPETEYRHGTIPGLQA